MKTYTYTVLKWAVKWWFPDIVDLSIPLIKYILQLIFKYIKSRGLLWTIKRIKLIRLVVTRYICGEPIKVYPDIIGLTKEGFPKSILVFKPLVDSGNHQELSFVLTLLGLSRTIDYKSKPDYSPITDPYSGVISRFSPEENSFIKDFVKDFNLEITRNIFEWDWIFFTGKAGPIGQALNTALYHIKLWNGVH